MLDDPALNIEGQDQYKKDFLGQWMRQAPDGRWEKCALHVTLNFMHCKHFVPLTVLGQSSTFNLHFQVLRNL